MFKLSPRLSSDLTSAFLVFLISSCLFACILWCFHLFWPEQTMCLILGEFFTVGTKVPKVYKSNSLSVRYLSVLPSSPIGWIFKAFDWSMNVKGK